MRLFTISILWAPIQTHIKGQTDKGAFKTDHDQAIEDNVYLI